MYDSALQQSNDFSWLIVDISQVESCQHVVNSNNIFNAFMVTNTERRANRRIKAKMTKEVPAQLYVDSSNPTRTTGPRLFAETSDSLD